MIKTTWLWPYIYSAEAEEVRRYGVAARGIRCVPATVAMQRKLTGHPLATASLKFVYTHMYY